MILKGSFQNFYKQKNFNVKFKTNDWFPISCKQKFSNKQFTSCFVKTIPQKKTFSTQLNKDPNQKIPFYESSSKDVSYETSKEAFNEVPKETSKETSKEASNETSKKKEEEVENEKIFEEIANLEKDVKEYLSLKKDPNLLDKTSIINNLEFSVHKRLLSLVLPPSLFSSESEPFRLKNYNWFLAFWRNSEGFSLLNNYMEKFSSREFLIGAKNAFPVIFELFFQGNSKELLELTSPSFYENSIAPYIQEKVDPQKEIMNNTSSPNNKGFKVEVEKYLADVRRVELFGVEWGFHPNEALIKISENEKLTIPEEKRFVKITVFYKVLESWTLNVHLPNDSSGDTNQIKIVNKLNNYYFSWKGKVNLPSALNSTSDINPHWVLDKWMLFEKWRH